MPASLEALTLVTQAQQRQIEELIKRTSHLEAILGVISRYFGLGDLLSGVVNEQPPPNTPPSLHSTHDSNDASSTVRSWQDSCGSDVDNSHAAAATAQTSTLLSRAFAAAAVPHPAACKVAALSAVDAAGGDHGGNESMPYAFRNGSRRQDLDQSPDQEPSEVREFLQRACADQSQASGAVETQGRYPHEGQDAAGWTPAAARCNPDWTVRDDLSTDNTACTSVSPPPTFKPPRRLPPWVLRHANDVLGDSQHAAAWPPPAASAESTAGPLHDKQTASVPEAPVEEPSGSGAWGSPEDQGAGDSGGGEEARGAATSGGSEGGGVGVVARSGQDAFSELGGEERFMEVLEAAGSEPQPWIRRLAAHSSTAAAKAADCATKAADAAATRAAEAALVLMLQCRGDCSARMAVAASGDCLKAAAAMLRSGSRLEQRIAAHLFWFASRSREGAAALYGTCAAPSLSAVATLPELAAPGLVGLLVAATGSGDAHAAKAAAMALHNVLVSEGGAAAVENAGGCGLVPALMGMMAGTDEVRQEAAATALMVVAERSEALRAEMIELGCVEGLTNVLRTGGPPIQTVAAGALEHLSLEVEAAVRLVACGGVRRLVEILQHDAGEARVRASGVLRNMADVADCHPAIVRAGVLPLLVSIIVAPPPLCDSPCADGGSCGQPPPELKLQSDGDFRGETEDLGEEERAAEPARSVSYGGDDGEDDKENRAPLRGDEDVGAGRERDGGEIWIEQGEREGKREEWVDESVPPEVAEAQEVRVLAVNTLVNLATRSSCEMRRTLAASDGGGGGLWALLSVAEHSWMWDAETVAWALEGVLAISADRSLRAEVIRQGGRRVLQHVMLEGSPAQRELAAKAVANVTATASNDVNVELVERGAGTALVELLSAPPGICNAGARQAACCAIQNLARCAACRAPLLAAGAAEALTAIVVSGDDSVVVAAAVRALHNISRSLDCCEAMVTRGSVSSLVSALQRLSLGALALNPSPFGYGTAAAVGSGSAAAAWASVGPAGGGDEDVVGENEEETEENAGGVWQAAGGVRPGGKVVDLLAQVLKRLGLYGGEKSTIRKDVQAALAAASIL